MQPRHVTSSKRWVETDFRVNWSAYWNFKILFSCLVTFNQFDICDLMASLFIKTANSEIKGTGYTSCLFRHFYKRDFFCDLMFAFLYIKLLLKSGAFFPSRANPFLKDTKQFQHSCHPENISVPLKFWFMDAFYLLYQMFADIANDNQANIF